MQIGAEMLQVCNTTTKNQNILVFRLDCKHKL